MQKFKRSMSRISLFIAAFLAVGVIVAGCASIADIYVDKDPKQDFSTYKTFGWASDHPMTVETDYVLPITVQPRLNLAIKNTLIDKGYAFKSDASTADFAIAYTIGARDKIAVDTYTTPYYEHYDDWRWGQQYYPSPVMAGRMSPASSVTSYSAYQTIEGNLSIDIYDVKRRQPVWHGVAKEQISTRDLENRTVDLEQIVNSILKDF